MQCGKLDWQTGGPRVDQGTQQRHRVATAGKTDANASSLRIQSESRRKEGRNPVRKIS